MKIKKNHRDKISFAIIFFYLLPILLFCFYFIEILPTSLSWEIATLGLSVALVGSLVLVITMLYWERSLIKQLTPARLLQAQNQKDYPEGKMNQSSFEQAISFSDELGEKEQLVHQYNELASEFENYKQFAEDQILQKESLNLEFQKKINDLHGETEKKHQHSLQLESKIRDLSYEIKTLVQLADMNEPKSEEEELQVSETHFKYQVENDEDEPSFSINPEKQIRHPKEAILQLKRCIDIAQKQTGAYYFGGGSSRFRDLSTDHYTLDLRRLFDSLKSENSSVVLVYSHKDNKLLFVNNQVRGLFGWSPEKFVQDFSNLIDEGLDEWKMGLNQASMNGESQVRLLLKTKSGEDRLVHCHLGLIPTGLFKSHIVGILYPS